MWIKKRTVIGGQSRDDDWIVMRGQQAVGRVHPSPPMPGIQPLEWASWTHPCDRGRANSLEDALDQLREAIRARWPDDVPAVPRGGTRYSDDLP
ncbi:hypothetical protein MASR1M32_10410 [Rhodobacter sp.]